MRITRRQVQIALGLLWFADGVFQLKPAMFTHQFLSAVILPTAQMQPYWIAQSVLFGAHLIEPDVALWNVLFASIQFLIGVMLLANIRVRLALLISFAWSIIVWCFGEGFGQLWIGSATLLTGAPGAVLLYALVGCTIYPWPTADRTGIHTVLARRALAVLWIMGAILQLQPAYLEGGIWRQAVTVPVLASILAVHPGGRHSCSGHTSRHDGPAAAL